jgi:hypothetical protein
MWVRDSIDAGQLGYSDNWDNPTPNFDTYMGDHITQVKFLAVSSGWLPVARSPEGAEN